MWPSWPSYYGSPLDFIAFFGYLHTCLESIISLPNFLRLCISFIYIFWYVNMSNAYLWKVFLFNCVFSYITTCLKRYNLHQTFTSCVWKVMKSKPMQAFMVTSVYFLNLSLFSLNLFMYHIFGGNWINSISLKMQVYNTPTHNFRWYDSKFKHFLQYEIFLFD